MLKQFFLPSRRKILITTIFCVLLYVIYSLIAFQCTYDFIDYQRPMQVQLPVAGTPTICDIPVIFYFILGFHNRLIFTLEFVIYAYILACLFELLFKKLTKKKRRK